VSRPFVVALDGPAAAGKSTVGERLASRLGYFYFDTGVLYRAIAVAARRAGIDLLDEAALARLVTSVDVLVRPPTVADRRQHDVLLEGDDITACLRTPEVDGIVSQVAASAAVRDGLIDLQRRQVQGTGTVMVGRDIGTVVLPDADLKVFLDASPSERARRRLQQEGGRSEDLSRVLVSIERRDGIDASRAIAPLTVAADAVTIDTEGLTVEQVVDQIVGLIEQRRGRPPRVFA
jgi:CMP/dCMP kinase